MIKAILGDSYIESSTPWSSLPHIPQNPNNPLQGVMRISEADMQVFNGISWQTLSISAARINIAPIYQDTLNWAMAKMQQEKDMIAAAKTNTAVKIAMDNYINAKNQLDCTVILSKASHESTS